MRQSFNPEALPSLGDQGLGLVTDLVHPTSTFHILCAGVCAVAGPCVGGAAHWPRGVANRV